MRETLDRGRWMTARRWSVAARLAVLAATTIGARAAAAQVPDTLPAASPALSSLVAREAAARYNAPVALRAGARVDGGIFVVGGIVSGLDVARVAGEVRTYQAPLRYTPNGSEGITVEEPAGGEALFSWVRLRPRVERENGFRFRNYATYNRVEGLPIYAGPYITRPIPPGGVAAELFGVIRSAENFRWSSENVGHRATIEARTNG